MIPISESIASLMMFLGVIQSIFIIGLLWNNRQKLGVIWLITAAACFIMWGLTFNIIFTIQNQTISFIATRLFIITPFTTASAWFIFCYEFTSKKPIPRWVYSLFGIPIIVFIISIFNPSDLIFTVDPSNPYKIFPSEPNTLRFGLNVIVSYTLILFGTGMVIGEGLKSNNIFRKKQSFIIISTTFILIGLSLFKITDIVPTYFDPTPFSVSFGFLFIAYSIKNHKFSNQLNLARRDTLEQSNDGIIVTDSNNKVIDMNQTIKSFFGNNIYGDNIKTLFNPENKVIKLKIDNQYRDFKLNKTKVKSGRGTPATLYILSEITELKKHEEELKMVYTIMQRVFRHNVRNKLTPIIGHTQHIKEKTDSDSLINSVNQISSNAESIQNTSEKVVEIGKIINNRKLYKKDLGKDIINSIKTMKNKYPNTTINYDVTHTTVIAHPKLNRIIEEAIENGIKYNKNEIPTINIKMTENQKTVSLWIADDGIGIPDMEIQVLNEESETPIKHSNGAGLWLMKLITERSNGTQKFYNYEKINGTVTKLTFQKTTN